jgi:hypothetical protein
MLGKLGLFFVVLALVGTARCYNADYAASLGGLPVVGAMVSPPPVAPAYVNAIGTPAAVAVPETDFTKWFPTDAAVDPLDPAIWAGIDAFLATTGTQAGWAEACKKAGSAAGADRATNARIGALGCSSDASVTQFQQFAAKVLETQAAVALWMKGAPGGTLSAIQGRQGEVRVLCNSSLVSRQPATSPFVEACAKALDASYLSNGGDVTFGAIGEAYLLVADEIARLDPTVDAEPGYFGEAKGP